MKRSLRALLESLIDYAGLFPPASLDMAEAIARYDRYRHGESGWILGRFVVPAARVAEVPRDFALSVLVTPEEVGTFDTVEVKATAAADVARIAKNAQGTTVYVETTDRALLPAIAGAGLRAKIRTGGVTADAFPSVTDVAAFIRACAEEHVAFKATAGLHHPVRCVKPLTYAADAPVGTMHGFLNVFMAAALVDRAEDILLETDARAFTFEDDAAAWREHAIDTETLTMLRRDFAISFGSCSFEEPLDDLKELGWL